MSVDAADRTANETAIAMVPYRWLALLSAGVLTGSYLVVLVRVLDVAGGTAAITVFAFELLGALALSLAFSRVVPVRYAVALGSVLFVAGLVGYLASIPSVVFNVASQVADTIALLTGLSILRMRNAGIWALGFTPGPVFVSWYFFFRREYALGAAVGGLALGLFISTGDAGTLLGLAGVIGAVGAVGFGQLDVEGGTYPQRNTVIAVIVTMLVLTTSISLIPGGEAQPLLPNRGTQTVEGNIIDTGNRVFVTGSISLSPKVRFTVTASDRDYWRVGAYDRYTGGGWVRTDRSRPYTGPLERPDAGAETIRQTFRAETAVSVMPAAWKPVRVESGSAFTRVTSMEGLQPTVTFRPGEEYTVVSVRPDASVERLQRAGQTYPDAISSRYLQLPDSTPDRVATFTDELTADADTPYETATLIERWLQQNKDYSLDVSRPDGDIAASFLFEMEAGYCTYYATTMAVMLRTQGIPARMVVGYTPGQRVGDDTWVVRGLDSHAWVEAYFPGTGWVRFDPTPAGPRSSAERFRVQDAREGDEPNVDTDRSAGEPVRTAVARTTTTGTNGSTGGATNGSFDVGETPAIPSIGINPANPAGAAGGERGGPNIGVLVYVAILIGGIATLLLRTGFARRAYRAFWLRWSPRGSPRTRVEATFDRLEYVLARRYRPRRPDETPREYLQSLSLLGLDDRAFRLYGLYERARYSGEVSEADAERAGRLLRGIR